MLGLGDAVGAGVADAAGPVNEAGGLFGTLLYWTGWTHPRSAIGQ